MGFMQIQLCCFKEINWDNSYDLCCYCFYNFIDHEIGLS